MDSITEAEVSVNCTACNASECVLFQWLLTVALMAGIPWTWLIVGGFAAYLSYTMWVMYTIFSPPQCIGPGNHCVKSYLTKNPKMEVCVCVCVCFFTLVKCLLILFKVLILFVELLFLVWSLVWMVLLCLLLCFCVCVDVCFLLLLLMLLFCIHYNMCCICLHFLLVLVQILPVDSESLGLATLYSLIIFNKDILFLIFKFQYENCPL